MHQSESEEVNGTKYFLVWISTNFPGKCATFLVVQPSAIEETYNCWMLLFQSHSNQDFQSPDNLIKTKSVWILGWFQDSSFWIAASWGSSVNLSNKDLNREPATGLGVSRIFFFFIVSNCNFARNHQKLNFQILLMIHMWIHWRIFQNFLCRLYKLGNK